MKATIGTFFFISLFITSCTTKMKSSESDNSNKTTIVDAHNAQNVRDYVGIYYGTMPCADCERIETTL